MVNFKANLFIFLLLSGFGSLAQVPFRGAFQPSSIVHKIPYGANVYNPLVIEQAFMMKIEQLWISVRGVQI